MHYGVNQVRRVLEHFAARTEAERLSRMTESSYDELLRDWAAMWQQRTQEFMSDLHRDAFLWDNLNWSPPDGWAAISPDDKLMPSWNIVHTAREFLQSDGYVRALSAFETLSSGIELRGGAARQLGGQGHRWPKPKLCLKGIRERANEYLKIMPRPLADIDEEAARMLFLWRGCRRAHGRNLQ